MFINGLFHTTFGITSYDFDVQAADITSYDDWLRNAPLPTIVGRKEYYKKVTISFFFRGLTKQAVMERISNLIAALEQCTLQPDKTDFYYDCIIVSTNIKKYNGIQQVLEVELKAAYAYKPAVNETLTNITSKVITVLGNLATPAIVTITPSIDTVSVSLTGLSKSPIIINNLHANVPIIIDGEKCTIIEDDIELILTEVTGLNQWNFRKYNVSNFADPNDTDIHIAPTFNNIPAGASYSQKLITDASELIKNIGYDYVGYLKTAVNVTTGKTIDFDIYHDDGCSIYLDGALHYSSNYHVNEDTGKDNIALYLSAGWHTIEIIWIQHYGPDGIWGIVPIIGSQVNILNCFYAQSENENIQISGIVNKFADTDMWAFPALKPGVNTITINSTVCVVTAIYKPKWL